MALSINYPPVPKSITNENVLGKDVIDNDNPMSFLKFIKIINVSYEPDTLQNYYNSYIIEWDGVKKTSETSTEDIIVERYRDFLRDVSLRYTTLEEKKFLSKIDFNDPYDLKIALPFFSRKLIEIAKYYNSKREESKFEITKKKLKGSIVGGEKSILDIIINYLDNLEDGGIYFDIEDIKSKIEVEIEELYDEYSLYFNQTPNDKIYDNKDLDWGYDIFLKDTQELIDTVFSGLSEELITLKEIPDLIENKKRLSEKYLSTDFYYLSTGSTKTDFLSGRITDSGSIIPDFFNVDFPTTASTERMVFSTEREKGFFKPSKNNVIILDGVTNGFYFDFNNIEPNSVYYFPDPSKVGGDNNFVVILNTDSFLKKGHSSGQAINQPTSFQNDVKYNGYVSKIEPTKSKGFDKIFESGYIEDSKYDLYGNKYGLFIDNDSFKQSITYEEPNTIKSLLLNGGQFYDDIYGEGYSFDYTTFDDTTYTETLRSGLSSYTSSFSGLSSPYTLFFRYFEPFDELIQPTSSELVTTGRILEGAFFTEFDNSAFSDTISSDLSAYPGAGIFYYNTLIEAGIHTASPLQRALVDPSFPSLTANLAQTVTPGISSVVLIDGGGFINDVDFRLSFTYPTYTYINTTQSTSQYATSAYDVDNLYDRNLLSGQIFVKNVDTKEILSITSAMSYLSSSLGASFYQLSSSKDFEIYSNIMFVETQNYLNVFNIEYNNSEFVPSKNKSYVIHLSGTFQKVSNRFKIGTDVIYCVTEKLSGGIIPNLYRFNPITNINEKVFSTSNAGYVESDYNIDSINTHIDSPVLTYSSRNNVLKVSFLAKDQNEYFSIHEYDFDYQPTPILITHKVLSFDNSYTNTLNTLNILMDTGATETGGYIIV
jgi:hypothetical protein